MEFCGVVEWDGCTSIMVCGCFVLWVGGSGACVWRMGVHACMSRPPPHTSTHTCTHTPNNPHAIKTKTNPDPNRCGTGGPTCGWGTPWKCAPPCTRYAVSDAKPWWRFGRLCAYVMFVHETDPPPPPSPRRTTQPPPTKPHNNKNTNRTGGSRAWWWRSLTRRAW